MAKTATKPTPEKRQYFVPSLAGEMEAVDLVDLNKQLKKLQEQQEAGDGNK